MVKPKTGLACIVQRHPILTRSLQQGVGADDVRLNEIGGRRDRAVNVRLCRQMHDRVRLSLKQYTIDLVTVADINALEYITRALADFR
ncbi:hypothetical protein D3C76_1630890 [compost metagenome]